MATKTGDSVASLLTAINEIEKQRVTQQDINAEAFNAAAGNFDNTTGAGALLGGLLKGAAIGQKGEKAAQERTRLDALKAAYEQQLGVQQQAENMAKAAEYKLQNQNLVDIIADNIVNAPDDATGTAILQQNLKEYPDFAQFLQRVGKQYGVEADPTRLVMRGGQLVQLTPDATAVEFSAGSPKILGSSAQKEKWLKNQKSEFDALNPVQQATTAMERTLTDEEKAIAAGIAKAPQIQGTRAEVMGGGIPGGAAVGKKETEELAKEAARMFGEVNKAAEQSSVRIKEYQGALEASERLGGVSLADKGASIIVGALGETSAKKDDLEKMNRIAKQAVLDLQKEQAGVQTEGDRAYMAEVAAMGDTFSPKTRYQAFVAGQANEGIKLARQAFFQEYLRQEGTTVGAAAAFNKMLASDDVIKYEGDKPVVNNALLGSWGKFLPSALNQGQPVSAPAQPGLLEAPPGMKVTNDGSSGGVPEIVQPSPSIQKWGRGPDGRPVRIN